MGQRDTCTKGMRQFQGILHRHQGGVALRNGGVGRHDPTHGISAQLMAQAIGETHCQEIILTESIVVLHTEIEGVTVHLGRIVFGELVDGRTSAGCHSPIITAPDIADIDTHGERFQRTGTHTHKDLVETTIATIGGEHRVVYIQLRRGTELIPHIRQGQDAKGGAHVL